MPLPKSTMFFIVSSLGLIWVLLPFRLMRYIPLQSMDNHPLVSPLVVMGFKTIINKGVRIKQALVQWQGLFTGWHFLGKLEWIENYSQPWEQGCFPWGDIDMSAKSEEAQSVNEDVQNERPKRIVKQKHVSDNVYY